jgi:hypothetical protein
MEAKALERAARYVDGHDVELREGDRLIKRFDHTEKRQLPEISSLQKKQTRGEGRQDGPARADYNPEYKRPPHPFFDGGGDVIRPRVRVKVHTTAVSRDLFFCVQLHHVVSARVADQGGHTPQISSSVTLGTL